MTSAAQGSPIVAPASVYAVVGECRGRSGARLDHHLDAVAEPADRLRDERHAALAGRVSLGTPTRMTRDATGTSGKPHLTLAIRDAPAPALRALPALRRRRDRVGRRSDSGRDDADRRRVPRTAGAAPLLARLGDRRRGVRRDRRRQHRLLARPLRRAQALEPLVVHEASLRAGPAAGRALLRQARPEDGLHRPFHRLAAGHHRVARRDQPHALVEVPDLERRRRHRLGDGRVAAQLRSRARRSPRRSTATASTACSA